MKSAGCKILLILTASAVSTMALVGCGEETRVETRSTTEMRSGKPREHFAVGLQQDGRKIPIRNHVAVLEKKPFSFVLLFSDQPGVLVNTRTDADLLERARRRRDLGRTAPLTNTVKAWKAPVLRARDDAWDYWYHYGLSQDMTKFDDVQRLKLRNGGSVMACKKVIQRVQLSGEGEEVPVEELSADRLHLVFVFAPAQVGGGRSESQRDWLTIVFK
jgi:hypothetical protein